MGFHEQLKIARLKMGYTQQQVAEIMGITKSTYCGYETGKRQPDVAKIKLLANILCTSGDVLLETGFDQNRNLHLSNSLSNQIEKEYGASSFQALELYGQLDVDDQGEIRGEIKQMLKAEKYLKKEEVNYA